MSDSSLMLIERARSGRSKCVTSSVMLGEPTYIELGELRIGVQAWAGGRHSLMLRSIRARGR